MASGREAGRAAIGPPRKGLSLCRRRMPCDLTAVADSPLGPPPLLDPLCPLRPQAGRPGLARLVEAHHEAVALQGVDAPVDLPVGEPQVHPAALGEDEGAGI